MPGNDYSEFEREWLELLNEVRVLLPGVQLLFGFLLAVPFFDLFVRSGPAVHGAYACSFLCASGATAFLVAPSVYHRLHWRRDVKDKEEMLRTCNRLAIVGVVLLALAMSSAVFVISFVAFGVPVAAVITALVGLTFATLWFILPLSRRARDQHRLPSSRSPMDGPS